MKYKDLLRYRQIWLGLAMLWIVLCHVPVDTGPIRRFKECGYGGVDICLFASGIGCFYSLSSNADLLSFMKRRLTRLAPTYLVFMVVWLAYQWLAGDFGFQMAVGNLLGLQEFTGLGYSFNWYIGALLLFYLLAPYFAAWIKRASSAGKMMFLAFLLACSIPFWRADTYIITIARLPIFYIGMLFADLCKRDEKMMRGHVIGLTAMFVLGIVLLAAPWPPVLLWSYGMYWYPFILITPPLCIAVSCIAMILEKRKATKWILSFLSLCGDYSFEIYLVHILLIAALAAMIRMFKLFDYYNQVWLATGALLFVGCFLLRRFTTLVTGMLVKRRSENN